MMLPDCPQLSFRKFELSDADFLMRLMNDDAFIEHIGDRGVKRIEDARNYIRSAIRPAYRRGNYGFWVISDKPGGEALGMAGLAKRDNLDLPDLGYALLPEARGQGHAMAASRGRARLWLWSAGPATHSRHHQSGERGFKQPAGPAWL